MLIEVLVNQQIEAGQTILKAIESAGVSVSSAFWCRMPEGEYWRLVIASPLVRHLGPLRGYKRLHKILESAGLQENFAQIAFLSPSDPEFKRLRAHALGPGNRQPRNLSLEDAFVYVA